jgi:hypothetical protein
LKKTFEASFLKRKRERNKFFEKMPKVVESSLSDYTPTFCCKKNLPPIIKTSLCIRMYVWQPKLSFCDNENQQIMKFNHALAYSWIISKFFFLQTPVFEAVIWPRVARWFRVKPKNPNSGKFCRALDWTMLIYFIASLKYFTDIRDIL